MKRLLIVDDSLDFRMILRSLFEHLGYACEEATHGLEALTWLEGNHFDLVIIDNQMPILGGLEFLDMLTKRLELANLPVIMLSGAVDSMVRERAFKAGARAVLQKPCSVSTIVSTVSTILEFSHPSRNLSYPTI